MITTNPFSLLSETIPSIALQAFVLVMVGLVAAGTILDIIHKKNVKYFFNNAKKAKKNATRELGTGERIAIIGKTIVHDIGTTSELGMGKRRIAHVLGMYGTILFWAGSAVMIFCYSSVNAETPIFWPAIWHLGGKRYVWLGHFISSSIRCFKYSSIWGGILVKICSYVL